jgi:hypothetical protein
MTLIVNNTDNFIILTAGKLSYLLCKYILIEYFESQNKNIDVNDIFIYNNKVNYELTYDIYIHIRNPFERIVSSFYAISNDNNFHEFIKLYNSFETFIEVLYDEFKNNKPFILKNAHIQQFTKQNGYQLVYNDIMNDKTKTMNDTSKYKVYECKELSNFINDFNIKYGINFPLGRFHPFDYNDKEPNIKNVHEINLNEIYKLRPTYKYFFEDKNIINKVYEIFKDDFDFSKKLGYNFFEF